MSIITTIQNEILHGYIYHYNPYTQMWAAIPRELVNTYFNEGITHPMIIKHKNIHDLIEYVQLDSNDTEYHRLKSKDITD